MYSGESGKEKLALERTELLRSARRVVVKVGTNVVAESEGGICAERLQSLVASIARLTEAGMQVVIVSSGAVGLGRGRIGLHRTRTADMVTRQACAAVGQALLMHSYERLFSAHGLNIAQVLLTEDDFMDRRRSSNLRHTMEKLLKLGVVPVVNENDTVSTVELEYVNSGGKARIFSDNDRLAALVASKVDANALVLLTNVEGLLRMSSHETQRQRLAGAPAPKRGDTAAEAKLIPLVKQITPEVKALASGPSQGGRGGMLTKLEAAEIATRAGAVVVIANGTRPDVLDKIFAGELVGTAFLPASRMRGKRRWIAYAAEVRGRVAVNAGARTAITSGKASLLWSGVVGVQRRFSASDVISITDSEGQEFARGMANHGSDEAELLAASGRGRNGKSGRAKPVVLVKRDDIVVLEQ